MSESTRNAGLLLVSRKQARQLAAWADGVEFSRHLTRIVKQGRFAYFTDRFVAVRWDVEGLDVPDGSWIALYPQAPSQGSENPDTLTNMANWSLTARKGECWDLMDEKRWRGPDGVETRDYGSLFTRARKAKTPVRFNVRLLAGLSLVVTGRKYGHVVMSPARKDEQSPWWVMGLNKRVSGMVAPSGRGYDLPEAYTEKKEEGQQ